MHLMLYAFNAMTKLCHGQAGLAGLSSRSDPLVEARAALPVVHASCRTAFGLAVRACTYLDGRCHRAAANMVSTTALIRLSPVSLRKNGREPQ